MKKLLFLFCLIGIQNLFAQNAKPIVSNLSITDNGNKQLNIRFNISDAENDTLEISLKIKGANTHKFYDVSKATGNIGKNQLAASNLQIIWSYDSLSINENISIKVYADDAKHSFSVQDALAMVDTIKMKTDMDTLEGTRHYTAGKQRLTQIKDTIRTRFVNENLRLREQNFQYMNYTAQNIEGTLEGNIAEEEYLIIDAHFDCVSNGPGADDNLSAVVAMLEAARVLNHFEFKRSIKFVGFDLEELGLLGSKEYVRNFLNKSEKLNAVLNFEMIGYYSERNNSQSLPAGFNIAFPDAYNKVAVDTFKGNFITNVGNVNSSTLVNNYASMAQQYVPSLKVVSVKVPGNGTIAPDLRRSDHAAFWDAGYQALMLTDGANFRNKNYHTAFDVSDSLNFDFMSKVLKTTLATAITLSEFSHAGMAQKDTFLVNVVGIDRQQKTSMVNIHPNPAHISFSIDWHESMKVEQIELYNLEGKLVYKAQISSKTNHIIDTELMPAGVYILRLKNGQENIERKLVIKHS